MRILGISTLGRGSAVALLDETSVLFAIEEEKLNRLEDTLEIPRLALARCLKENQLQAFRLPRHRRGRTVSSNLEIFLATSKRQPPSATLEQLRGLLRGGPRPSHFDHHLCHAASAYYTSEFDGALILSLDQGTSSQAGLVASGRSR